MTNPEKNMHNRLKNVQKRITFNFENFANATDDILQLDVNAFDQEEIKDDSPTKRSMEKRKSVQLDQQSSLLQSEKKNASRLASDDNFNIVAKQTKARYILTQSQRERWNKIIQHVPQEYRVYIQASFHQLKAAQRDY